MAQLEIYDVGTCQRPLQMLCVQAGAVLDATTSRLTAVRAVREVRIHIGFVVLDNQKHSSLQSRKNLLHLPSCLHQPFHQQDFVNILVNMASAAGI